MSRNASVFSLSKSLKEGISPKRPEVRNTSITLSVARKHTLDDFTEDTSCHCVFDDLKSSSEMRRFFVQVFAWVRDADDGVVVSLDPSCRDTRGK
jgi:hypothetical protein